MNKKRILFLGCCYGYGVSGMAVLVIGAILPSIMEESGMNFTTAGGLLSMMAVGNLTASFLFPVLTAKIGRRPAISIAAGLVPVSLFVLTLLPSFGWMYAALFLAGIGRGSITIINNSTVNIISNNSSRELNLLHGSFAIGAFLAPFLTAALYAAGLGWRKILYFIIGLCITSTCSYLLMQYPDVPGIKDAEASKQSKAFKTPAFYCLAFILFFYLGMENCINGWFVTYLKSTGVMSTAYATKMVSVTWLVILAGRLCCAALAKRMPKSRVLLLNAFSSGLFFFLLIFSSSLAGVTIALLGLGFSLAGIYPTDVAEAGRYIKGSTVGMSVLTAISALGGIITPQLIGSVADRIGIVAAISTLSINVVVLLFLTAFYHQKMAGSTSD